MLDGNENVWSFDASFEEFQKVCPSDPEAIMHYTIDGSQYLDQPMSVTLQEWDEFKLRVKEYGVSKRAIMESSNARTWESPDTRRQKETEQTFQTKPPKVKSSKGGKRVLRKVAAKAKASKTT